MRVWGPQWCWWACNSGQLLARVQASQTSPGALHPQNLVFRRSLPVGYISQNLRFQCFLGFFFQCNMAKHTFLKPSSVFLKPQTCLNFAHLSTPNPFGCLIVTFYQTRTCLYFELFNNPNYSLLLFLQNPFNRVFTQISLI